MNKIIKNVILNMIVFYRKFISPLKKPCCRFFPTCSKYALEAFERFGVIYGGILAVYRILRCNPFCKAGYDPVPSELNFKLKFKKHKINK